jgi:hypothetical protein
MANQVIIPDLACIVETPPVLADAVKVIARYKWDPNLNGNPLNTRNNILFDVDPYGTGYVGNSYNYGYVRNHPISGDLLLQWNGGIGDEPSQGPGGDKTGPSSVYADGDAVLTNYPSASYFDLKFNAFWSTSGQTVTEGYKLDGKFIIEIDIYSGGTISTVDIPGGGKDYINTGGVFQKRISIETFTDMAIPGPGAGYEGDTVGYLRYNFTTKESVFVSNRGAQINEATYSSSSLYLPPETAAILDEIASTVPEPDKPGKVCPAEPDAVFSSEPQPPGTTPFAPWCGPIVIPPFSATGPGPVYTEIVGGEGNPWFYSYSTDFTGTGGDYPAAAEQDGIGEGWQSSSFIGTSIAIGKLSFAATWPSIAIGESASAIPISFRSPYGANAYLGYRPGNPDLPPLIPGGNPELGATVVGSMAIGHGAIATSDYYFDSYFGDDYIRGFAGGAISIGQSARSAESATAIGNFAQAAIGCISIGECAGAAATYRTQGNVSSGYNNVESIAIGNNALQQCEGINSFGNVAIGFHALQKLGSGVDNVCIGRQSWMSSTQNLTTESLITPHGNVMVGCGIMSQGGQIHYTTVVGHAGGTNNVDGDNNTCIGAFTLPYPGLRGGGLYTKIENITCVGYQADVSGNNQVQLGNSATTTYVYGSVQARSDIRDKTDIRNTSLGLDFINKLRPVDFKWDYREDYVRYYQEEEEKDGKKITVTKHEILPKDGSKKRNRYHHGLIAQEVKEVIDELGIDFGGYQDHSVKGGGDILSVGYQELVAPLIKAVQELSLQVEDLQSQLNDMKDQKYK